MDKSPDAFRTISEAAEELDLPQHVLRFWETRFPTIRPLKRGGGRRFYRPDDVLLLKGIRHLLYDQGFTIKGVQRILKEQGVRHVIAIGDGQPFDPAMSAQSPGPGADERGDAVADEPAEPAMWDGRDESEAEDGAELPAVQPAIPHRVDVPGLSAADRQRLEAVLRELLDCKRLLDRARGT